MAGILVRPGPVPMVVPLPMVVLLPVVAALAGSSSLARASRSVTIPGVPIGDHEELPGDGQPDYEM